MKWKYSVSFEHPIQPVKTARGEVEGNIGTATRRAVNEAKKQFKGIRWTSMMAVMEKQAEDAETEV